MHTVLYDSIKREFYGYIKFGDDHTPEFDHWYPKKLIKIKKILTGYAVHMPSWYAKRENIL